MPKPDQPTAYDRWFSSLSAKARRAISEAPPVAESDEEHDYNCWRDSLSGRARDLVDAQAATAGEPVEPDDFDSGVVRYGLVECESGEYPVVRLFKSADAMARHLGKLEGRDVCAAAFYGYFLKIGRGPARLLQLPWRKALIAVPRDGLGPIHHVGADLVEFDWQEDGFLGPPDLANSAALEEKLDGMVKNYTMPPLTQGDPHPDDDEDEEDEGEGEDTYD